MRMLGRERAVFTLLRPPDPESLPVMRGDVPKECGAASIVDIAIRLLSLMASSPGLEGLARTRGSKPLMPQVLRRPWTDLRLDLLADPVARVLQVVGCLHPYPEFCAGAEIAGKS